MRCCIRPDGVPGTEAGGVEPDALEEGRTDAGRATWPSVAVWREEDAWGVAGRFDNKESTRSLTSLRDVTKGY